MNNEKSPKVAFFCVIGAIMAFLMAMVIVVLGNADVRHQNQLDDHETRISRLESWLEEVAGFDADVDPSVDALDGTDANTPWLDQSLPTNANTTISEFTPGSLSGATFAEVSARLGRPVCSWGDIYQIGRDNPWYARAFDTYSRQLGFNWADVERWGNDSRLDNTCTTAIVLLGGRNVTDAEAREAVARELPGVMRIDQIPVVRLPGGVMNTMSPSSQTIRVFGDSRAQIRLSLIPMVESKSGELLMNSEFSSGVFVDCLNLWWRTAPGVTPPARPTPQPTPTQPAPGPSPTPTPPPGPGPSPSPSPTPTPTPTEPPVVPPVCPPGTDHAGGPIPGGNPVMCNDPVVPLPSPLCPPGTDKAGEQIPPGQGQGWCNNPVAPPRCPYNPNLELSDPNCVQKGPEFPTPPGGAVPPGNVNNPDNPGVDVPPVVANPVQPDVPPAAPAPDIQAPGATLPSDPDIMDNAPPVGQVPDNPGNVHEEGEPPLPATIVPGLGTAQTIAVVLLAAASLVLITKLPRRLRVEG